MRDLNYHWRTGRVVKRLWLRPLYFDNPFRAVWRWLRGRSYGTDRPEWSFRSWGESQDECYCPNGRITRFRVQLFGVCLVGSYAADWTSRPCQCSKMMWLMFPDSYPWEIEEYGLAKLQVEFPGVEPA